MMGKTETEKDGREVNSYIIGESGVTARHRQQLTHDVHVTVFAGTHERRGAVVITDVDLCSAGQQRPHHVPSTMADC